MPKSKAEECSTQLSASAQSTFDKVLRAAIGSATLEDTDLLLGLLDQQDYWGLLNWVDGRPTPQEYESEALFYADYQIATLIKKYPYQPDLVPQLTPRETAIEKFLASEEKCKEVNLDLAMHHREMKLDAYAEVKRIARKRILDIIGEEPDLEEIYDLCDITAGASMGINGSKTNTARKLNA